MSNIRFFQCKECGLMAASLNDKVIPNLNELIPNTVEASGESTSPWSRWTAIRSSSASVLWLIPWWKSTGSSGSGCRPARAASTRSFSPVRLPRPSSSWSGRLPLPLTPTAICTACGRPNCKVNNKKPPHRAAFLFYSVSMVSNCSSTRSSMARDASG